MLRKQVIDKNVDHMNLRKISLHGSVKNILYNKFIDSHLRFIFLHNTTSCACRLSACIFIEKAKHRSRSLSLPFWVFDNLRNTWHHVRNTHCRNVDACPNAFPRCYTLALCCASTITIMLEIATFARRRLCWLRVRNKYFLTITKTDTNRIRMTGLLRIIISSII